MKRSRPYDLPAETGTAELALNVVDESSVLRTAPQKVVIAGFTGRDQEEVQAHIRELASLGVPAPECTPVFWTVPSELLVTQSEIVVSSPESSGEAEPVLICDGGRWFVAVGSDHTARDIERVDFQQGKEACPKVLSRDVITYECAQEGWDNAVLTSWVRGDGGEALYQRGTLSELLPVPDILNGVQQHIRESTSRLVVFLGTVSLQQPNYVFGGRFRAELRFTTPAIALECAYGVTHREGFR